MADLSAVIAPADPTLMAVDAAIEARGNAERARPYLGMSEIGRECARATWYGFRWCSPSNFDAATLRRFEDGHRSEAIMIERLRAVTGITLHTQSNLRPGEQIACSDIGGHLRGHLDGVIVGLIQSPATPHCWEHKATNEKKQATLLKLKAQIGEKQALAKWDATYYAQGQLYMHYQGLTRHYLTCDSAGSRTTVSCRTNADKQAAGALIERARRIITAQEPPTRISERQDWYQCRWCQHSEICHDGKPPEVSCRTCAHATPETDGDGRWSCARYHCDIGTTIQRQGAQCPSHVYIPALLRLEQVDANEEQGWIEYRKPDGAIVRNGPVGYRSQEIKENLDICGDALVTRAKAEMGAEVAGP